MKHLIRTGLFLVVAAVGLAIFPSGCGSDAPPAEITLTGTLSGSRGVLAGYKFKCVTLTKPAYSSVATADSTGAFTIKFSAADVPFGCFVLDASDVQKATTFFTSTTESKTSQTIRIAGTNSLGTVTVDTSRGKATASIPAATSKGVDGLECPVGVWSGTVGVNAAPCAGETVTLTLWIGKDSAGNYTVTQVMDPVAPATCGVSSYVPTASTFTFANSKVNYSINFGHAATAAVDVSSDCNEMFLTMTQTGCVTPCGATASLNNVCGGAGATTCVSDVFKLVKQK